MKIRGHITKPCFLAFWFIDGDRSGRRWDVHKRAKKVRFVFESGVVCVPRTASAVTSSSLKTSPSADTIPKTASKGTVS